MDDQPKQYEIWKPFLLALIMAIGMVVGTQLDDELAEGPLIDRARDEGWDKLIRTIGFIQSRYDDSLNTDSLSDEAIQWLMSNLDPHSYFLTGLENSYFKDRMGGSYDGIGIEYEIIDDTIYLINVLPETPADQAGLDVGDRILAVDSQRISGRQLSAKEAYEVWKSTGTSLQLTYLPHSGDTTYVLSVEKSKIKISSVPMSAMVGDSIGFIKINHFADHTYQDFMDSLGILVDQGMKHLMIDVRNNPGGSFQEVVKVLNQLIAEKDRLMVYMDGKHVKRTEYKSTGKPFFQIGRIVVLVDEHSASASEVLAGALQDLGRATIVGRRTYGKALVQEMYHLGANTSINLTIGKYYLPSGRFIQKIYSDKTTYRDELKMRLLNGELFAADSLRLDTNLMVEDGNQILRPVGQGIVPDIFVPADSMMYMAPWPEVKRLIKTASFRYYLQKGEEIGELLESDGDISQPLLDSIARQIERIHSLDSLATRENDWAPLYDLYLASLYTWTGKKYKHSQWLLNKDEMIRKGLDHLSTL